MPWCPPYVRERRGSVVLEFMLMLPVLLLLIGMTLLTYDSLDGKMKLQQANRLFAWMTGDRYAAKKDEFNKQVVAKAKHPFELRNAMERTIDASGGDMWVYGSHERLWAVNVESKQTEAGTFIGATPWAILAAGNMELEMRKVSASYVGILGVSSVLHGNGEDVGKGITASSFDLTHTAVHGEDAVSDADYSPESMVLRRYNDQHAYRDVHYRSRIWEIVTGEWPRLAENEPEPAGSDDEPNPEDYARRLYDYAQ